MKSPSKIFNKKVIGKIITKPMQFGEIYYDSDEYDVIEFDSDIYTLRMV